MGAGGDAGVGCVDLQREVGVSFVLGLVWGGRRVRIEGGDVEVVVVVGYGTGRGVAYLGCVRVGHRNTPRRAVHVAGLAGVEALGDGGLGRVGRGRGRVGRGGYRVGRGRLGAREEREAGGDKDG